jgi:hypothetical protein
MTLSTRAYLIEQFIEASAISFPLLRAVSRASGSPEMRRGHTNRTT